MAGSLSIVHLSDLHFGEHSRFKDRTPEELGRQLRTPICATLKERFGVEVPDIVIVTGDFTQKAAKNEFDAARTFFESLQAAIGVPRSRFVFLPGNHDVSWEASKAYFEKYPARREVEYDAELQQEMSALYDDFKNAFYKDDCKPDSAQLVRGAIRYCYPELRLSVVALNSCEQETHEKPHGMISKAQAQSVMDLWKEDHKEDIRILALHHPVNALPDKPMIYLDALLEKKRITKDLLLRFKGDASSVEGNEYLNRVVEGCEVHLLLHGHQHAYDPPHPKKWFQPSTESCQICPAGSFAVRPDAELIDQPNCFNLIHLKENNSRMHMSRVVMEYDPMHKERYELDAGFYRDLKRPSNIAEFPALPGRTGEFADWIADRLAELFESDNALLSAMARLGDTSTSNPRTLSRRVADIGFASVWMTVRRNLDKFEGHFDTLRRALFLLAQAECKGEIVDEIKQLRESGAAESDFSVRIRERYLNLMGLVLNTGFEIEFSGAENFRNRVVTPGESGLVPERQYEEIVGHLMQKFGIIADSKATPGAIQERMKRLEGRLKAYYVSLEPFVAQHRGDKGLGIPYLVQFILPPATWTGSETEKKIKALTESGDDYVDQLLEIIMDKTRKR